jgi:hypothetical protein
VSSEIRLEGERGVLRPCSQVDKNVQCMRCDGWVRVHVMMGTDKGEGTCDDGDGRG